MDLHSYSAPSKVSVHRRQWILLDDSAGGSGGNARYAAVDLVLKEAANSTMINMGIGESNRIFREHVAVKMEGIVECQKLAEDLESHPPLLSLATGSALLSMSAVHALQMDPNAS